QARIVLFNAGRFPQIKRQDLAAAGVGEAQRLVDGIQMVSLDGSVDPNIMPAVYSAADWLLVTSDREGGPRVVREAMACILPVLCVDVGDVGERIRNDRYSRVVARDARVIGEAIADILRIPSRSGGREAVSELAEPRVAAQLRGIYEDVIAAAHGRWGMKATAMRNHGSGL